jgi:hypothetical protein
MQLLRGIKAMVNEKGLFSGFALEGMPKRELPFEVQEVEITRENFKEIKEIQKQTGAPVLIDGVFVNKKAEIANFVVSSNKTI